MSKLKFLDKIGRPFLSNRFLIIAFIIVGVFALGFPFPILETLGKILFFAFVFSLALDIYLLYLAKSELNGERFLNEPLSNGDSNPIHYQLNGFFSFPPLLELIDEFPEQLQLRNVSFFLSPKSKRFSIEKTFEIYPKTRGEYHFGAMKVLVKSPISLLSRLISISQERTVKVYPSVIQFKHYSFLAYKNRLEEVGVKKLRRLGDSSEFEQIKEYSIGDNFKRINWKATARKDQLMVNHYEDERAQHIYFLIDKGRMMHMPFNGLSLLDYAINSTLALSGVAKEKGDKVGLITFSDVIGSWIPASTKNGQISVINEALYHQEPRLKESDYSRLYRNVRTKLKNRSMLLLFTNFDSKVSLQRQLKYLKALSKSHLLVLIAFENQEVKQVAQTKVESQNAYFDQSIAEKMLLEKRLIINELNLSGIYTIITSPEQLTVNAINKYLEIKSSGKL